MVKAGVTFHKIKEKGEMKQGIKLNLDWTEREVKNSF